MTKHEQAQLTADAMAAIIRTKVGYVKSIFAEIWDETACGHETHGKRNLVWTSFVRDNADSHYWFVRVRAAVGRKLAGIN